MELFEKQIKHYTEKYNETKKLFNEKDYTVIQKVSGITDLKSAFEANDEKFEKFVLTYAKIMPGRVSCTTYAAAVAKIADDLGVKYRIYAGFCVPKSFPKYEEDKKAFKEKRDNGVEHPMFPTHVYLETAKGVIYEYYNGEKDIDHIDSVVIG